MVATHTHIMEVCDGLVGRSCRLPPGVGKVSGLSLVFALRGDRWSYMVRGEPGTVVFVSGESFVVTGRRYEHVESVVMGDFLYSGQRALCVSLGLAQYVLTDGETELDTTGMWPPGEEGRRGGVD